MRNILILILISGIWSCKPEKTQVQNFATFTGQQVTGVTVSDKGRVFANFPRWRAGVKHSVIEVSENGTSTAYPDQEWNNWEMGKTVSDSVFVAIQSVVAFENILYVLDTRNPLFKGVIDSPRVFAFDLSSGSINKNLYAKQRKFS